MRPIALGSYTAEWARPYKAISAVLAVVNKYLTMPTLNWWLVYSSGHGFYGVPRWLRALGIWSLPSFTFSVNGSWNPFRRAAFSRGAGYRGGWTFKVGVNMKTQAGGCGAENHPLVIQFRTTFGRTPILLGIGPRRDGYPWW
jgi:hypothetical protein